MRLNSWLAAVYQRLARPEFRRTAQRDRRRRMLPGMLEQLEWRRMLAGTTIVVDTLGDTSVAGKTTLRDAITQANADAGNSDTITFASSVQGSIFLTQGPLTIANSMTIVGPGGGLLSISGNGAQIFLINDSSASTNINVEIDKMALISGGAAGVNGGAIDNSESLTIKDSSLAQNVAGLGGAIYNEKTGVLTSKNNNFVDNSTGLASGAFGGGAIYNVAGGVVTSTDDTYSGNMAKGNSSGTGGAIYNDGTFTISNGSFDHNVADVGGAIETNSIVTSSVSTYTANQATLSGGVIDITSKGTFNSTGDSITSNFAATGGAVENSNVLTLVNVSLDGNQTSQGGAGGAIENKGTITSRGSTISNNTATVGGAVSNTGTWLSTNDTIANNFAATGSGGIDNAGTLTTVNDTITGNRESGVTLTGKTWTAVNTMVAGNLRGAVPTDIVVTGGTIAATSSLIGDATTAGGIVNGTNGNIVGRATNTIFPLDGFGKPLLADNGISPTANTDNNAALQTVALLATSPAIAAGAPLATVTGAMDSLTGSETIVVSASALLEVGDYLKIDNELLLVTGITDGTHITVLRGQLNTPITTHADASPLNLGIDGRDYARGVVDLGAISAVRTIQVNNGGDQEAIGATTLRDAAIYANIEVPGDTITFQPGLSGTITLTQGEIALNNEMTITGPGSATLAVSGNNSNRIFDIYSTTSIPFSVSMTGLTLKLANSNFSSRDPGNGGAIDNDQTLNLSGVVFDSNSATNGAALYNTGTVNSQGNTFQNNFAGSFGGGLYSSGTINSSNDVFTGNTAQYAGALWVAASGNVFTTGDTFGSNTAIQDGGAVGSAGTWSSIQDSFTGNSGRNGGAISNSGVASLMQDTLTANSAGFGGGVYNAGTLTLNSSTANSNTATTDGGALYNSAASVVFSTNVTYAYNSSSTGHGGGLTNAGTLNSLNDTIAGNIGGGFNDLGTWHVVNSAIAGNLNVAGAVANDILNTGTISADHTLVGDAGTAGGITNGVNGNLVGFAVSSVFVVAGNGRPQLANNGGPTQTIALTAGGAAIAQGTSLAALAASVTGSDSTLTMNTTADLAAGTVIRIDNEFLRVVSIINSTQVQVQRAQSGSAITSHAAGAAITLGFDERGYARGVNDLGAYSAPRSIIVDIAGDTEVSGRTTLRDAVVESNIEAPGNTITFQNTIGNLITLRQGDIPISNTMAITGPGAFALTVSGGNSQRLFSINSPAAAAISVTMTGLQLAGGNSTGSSTNPGLGGAIYNTETLVLSNITFDSNRATSGGALYNAGLVTTSHDTYSNNSATSSGGAVENGAAARVNSSNDQFSNNSAGSGQGGAIDNAGTWMSNTDTLTSNSAAIGGAMNNSSLLQCISDLLTNNTAQQGGAVNNSLQFAMSDSTVSNNSGNRGGGLYNQTNAVLQSFGCLITGNISNDANGGTGGGIYNEANGHVNSEADTYSNNIATGNNRGAGGGIFNAGFLNLNDSTLSGNTADLGGGINNSNTGYVTAGAETYSNNSASVRGGGIMNSGHFDSNADSLTGNQAIFGGAVDNSGALKLQNSTIENNSAQQGGGINNESTGVLRTIHAAISGNTASSLTGGLGGGIANAVGGQLTSTNDEITGNVASGQSNGSGGGIYNVGSLNMTYETISGNSADLGGGIANPGTLASLYSTVSNNTAIRQGGGLYNGGTGQDGIVASGSDTFSGNGASQGGALYTSSGNLNLTNDTLANNTATQGGGIYNFAGTLTTVNDTVAGNQAASAAGGIANDGAVVWNTVNSLIAGNRQGTPLVGSDIMTVNPGGTTNARSNLIGDTLTSGGILNGVNGNLTGAATSSIFVTDTNGQPLLADNSGPTQTIALAANSPALGQGTLVLGTARISLPMNGTQATILTDSTNNFQVGDYIRIDHEIFLVTRIVSSGSMLVNRAQMGTMTAIHAFGAPISLAVDQRGYGRVINDLGSFAPNRTITVDVLGDANVSGHTTLRNAIDEANLAAPGDTIVFAKNLSGSILLSQGELQLTNSMTIAGPTNRVMTIDAGNASRIFEIYSSTPITVTIQDLALKDGNGNQSTSHSGQGGAIYNSQTLFLLSNTYLSNTSNTGGAIANVGSITSSHESFTGNSAIYGAGGAILNMGSLMSSQDQFTNNTATAEGGAIHNTSQLSIDGDQFQGNSAKAGGALSNSATVTSRSTTYDSNSATTAGGGINTSGSLVSQNDTYSNNTAATGGGLVNSANATLTNDTFAQNIAGLGSGIDNTSSLTTVYTTIAGNIGVGGVRNEGTWLAVNTIVAGNIVSAGSATASDVSNTGTVQAFSSLIGDLNSSGGIVDGTFGNQVGVPATAVFETDSNGRPVLADHGGPTRSVAILPGSAAVGRAIRIATSSFQVPQTSNTTTMSVDSTQFIAAGEFLKLDSEIVQVTQVTDATHVVIARGLNGTSPASHAAGTALNLATDGRGFARNVFDLGAFAATRTITVSTLGDTHVAGQITLRDAVQMANQEGPGDTIVFAPAVKGSITLTQGEIPLTNSMTISGPGAANLTISGNDVSRIFDIQAAGPQIDVAISGLTMSHGNSDSSQNNPGQGGAIFNAENLTLTDDIFTANSTTLLGAGAGGAIFNTVTIHSSRTHYFGNAANDGGAVFNGAGQFVSSGDLFANNSATNTGGAIANSGLLTTFQDTFSANTARNGGALINTDAANSQADTYSGNVALNQGGALLNFATLSLTNDTVAGNTAASGGGLYQVSGQLTTVHTTIAANTGGGVGIGQGAWEVRNSIVAGNRVTGSPGNPSDIIRTGGLIHAVNTLVGDASTAGGITNGTAGNLVGVPVNSIFVTDSNGQPLLANHGGATMTIALAPNSPAIAHGAALAVVAAAVANSSASTTIVVNSTADVAVGTLLRIDQEFVLVTAVSDATHLIVERAQAGTLPAAHPLNASLTLAEDQRGAVRGTIDLGAYTAPRTLTVDLAGDSSSPGHLTLRDAIALANVDPPGDTIVFAPGVTGTIRLTQGELLISNAMTITGPAGQGLMIAANYASRIFDIRGTAPLTVTISNLGLTQGNSHYSSSTPGLGGAIYNIRTLYLSNVSIFGNSAVSGGAIYNAGSLIATNDTFANNSATNGGGLFNTGTLTTVNDTVAGNLSGGLLNKGFWRSINTIVAGNLATPGATTALDVTNTSGTVSALSTLIGDPNSAGGIVNGVNGNIVGKTVSSLFATNSLGQPLLAANGGPTRTIALIAKGPAVGNGAALTQITNALPNSSLATTIPVTSTANLAVGDWLRVDSELLLVTGIVDGTHLAVARAQRGSSAAAHVPHSSLYLAADETGALRINQDRGAFAEINHAPNGISSTVSAVENTTYVFKTSDFPFTDPGDLPANQLAGVKITLLPTLGLLMDNGQPVTVNQLIPASDIAAGKLTFQPQANLTQGPYFLGKFQVQDNGGTANGGVNLDPVAKPMYVKLAPINAAPVGAAHTVTLREDSAYAFRLEDFGFSDPGNNPQNSLQAVKIASLPAVGRLTNHGATVTQGAFIPLSDITSGQFQYLPAANGFGTRYSQFTFQVRDNGGTANGGVDTDPTPRQMTMSVSSVNDAPRGTSGTVTSTVSQSYTLQVSDFGFTDPNDSPANAFQGVKFTVLPTLGTLALNGQPVQQNQFVGVSDITNGKLVFTPRSNLAAGTYFLAKFQVQDNGGVANGGQNIDPVAKVLYIKLLPTI